MLYRCMDPCFVLLVAETVAAVYLCTLIGAGVSGMS